MATIVYQGLQSCLESQVLESRTLRLRLSSPKPHFSQPLELTLKSTFLDSDTKQVEEEKCHSEENSKETNNLSSDADLGCWSFLQALSNGSPLGTSKDTLDKENTYVHPLDKRSMSSLSEKSLELCTESLGSETGTDILEDNIFSSSSSSAGNYNSPTREQQKPRQLLGAKKVSSRSFPPPLTTLSGLESLQVKPHREDGRLIIKATKAPATQSLFQAERSHGRLRLTFAKPYFDAEEMATDANYSKDIETEYLDEEDEEEEEEREMDLEEHEDVEEEEEKDAYLEDWEKNENSIDVGVKMGMKKFKRPGRCKEGEPESKGLLNWESFWVATS